MRRRAAALILALAAAIVVVDQITKAMVRVRLTPQTPSISILGDLVRLTLTRNSGAAFGLLPGNRIMFITVSTLVLVGVAAYVWKYRPTRPWVVIALGLLAGGAFGNLIDRAVIGTVTDFIQIPFDFPVFNVADSGIVVGVAMLVWWLLFGPVPDAAVAREGAEGETEGDGAATTDSGAAAEAGPAAGSPAEPDAADDVRP